MPGQPLCKQPTHRRCSSSTDLRNNTALQHVTGAASLSGCHLRSQLVSAATECPCTATALQSTNVPAEFDSPSAFGLALKRLVNPSLKSCHGTKVGSCRLVKEVRALSSSDLQAIMLARPLQLYVWHQSQAHVDCQQTESDSRMRTECRPGGKLVHLADTHPAACRMQQACLLSLSYHLQYDQAALEYLQKWPEPACAQVVQLKGQASGGSQATITRPVSWWNLKAHLLSSFPDVTDTQVRSLVHLRVCMLADLDIAALAYLITQTQIAPRKDLKGSCVENDLP